LSETQDRNRACWKRRISQASISPYVIGHGASSPTIKDFANSTGIQAFNTTTTFTTAGAVGATCTTAAITLPVGYSDTTYRLNCTGQSATNVQVVETYTKSNTTFTITIAALTATAATFTSYDCLARIIHED